MTDKAKLIKKIYVYLFSMVGLILMIIGSVSLVNLALKTWVFKNADSVHIYPYEKPIVKEGTDIETEEEKEAREAEMIEYRESELKSRREQQASNAVAMILIGLPLFAYHWRLARKEE